MQSVDLYSSALWMHKLSIFTKKKSTKRQFDMKHSCSNKKEPELITLGLDFPSIHALLVLQQLLQIPFTVPKGVFEPLLDLLG